MKLKKRYISLVCMCSLALSSCDSFLEEKPLDQKDSNQFWQTQADAETGVNALYFGGVPYLHNTGEVGLPKLLSGEVLSPVCMLINVKTVSLQMHQRAVTLILRLSTIKP